MRSSLKTFLFNVYKNYQNVSNDKNDLKTFAKFSAKFIRRFPIISVELSRNIEIFPQICLGLIQFDSKLLFKLLLQFLKNTPKIPKCTKRFLIFFKYMQNCIIKMLLLFLLTKHLNISKVFSKMCSNSVKFHQNLSEIPTEFPHTFSRLSTKYSWSFTISPPPPPPKWLQVLQKLVWIFAYVKVSCDLWQVYFKLNKIFFRK